MTFDSNLAWREATAAIAANREVFYALAGVFFLLPTLAFALLHPQPQPEPGMTPEQAMELMKVFYAEALPWLVPLMLVQGVGSLAVMALLTDNRRPTVSEAIRLGALGLLPYLLAQFMLGIGMGLVGMVLAGLGAAIGGVPLAVLVGGLAVVLIVYAMVKTSLVSPIIMVEGQRNPVAALKRSWALTRGNSARIGLFYLLIGIAFVAVSLILGAVVGVVSALVAGPDVAKVVDAVVSSAIGSLVTLYSVAILAAVHRQLAGPGEAAISQTFE